MATNLVPDPMYINSLPVPFLRPTHFMDPISIGAIAIVLYFFIMGRKSEPKDVIMASAQQENSMRNNAIEAYLRDIKLPRFLGK